MGFLGKPSPKWQHRNRDLKDMTQQVTRTPGEMAEGIVSVRNKVVNKRVYQGGQ